MFLCTIRALEYLCTNHQPNICAQTVELWTSVCSPFVRLMNISDDCLLSVCAQTVDRYIGTNRKREFNENQENNTFREWKQLSQEKNPCIRQQTDSKWLSNVLVHKRLRGQIYIRLLSEHRTSVYCPFALQNFLLCSLRVHLTLYIDGK